MEDAVPCTVCVERYVMELEEGRMDPPLLCHGEMDDREWNDPYYGLVWKGIELVSGKRARIKVVIECPLGE